VTGKPKLSWLQFSKPDEPEAMRKDGLEDEFEDVGDENGYSSYKADVTGDTVSFALDFEKLAAGGSATDGDQSKR
jgi:hypothetical protein